MEEYAVILAGGSGKRLWPLSRKAKPKQFVDMLGGGSLLVHTVKRLEKLFNLDHILIVGLESQRDAMYEDIGDLLPRRNILFEPVGRNTAPSIALATEYLCSMGDSIICVLPSDHYIGDEESYLAIMRQAINAVETRDVIATVGIKPTYPATGYGYIHAGQPVENLPGGRYILEFVEKPDTDRARAYCEDGSYYWNGGMFVSRCMHMQKNFKTLMPELFQHVQNACKHMLKGEHEAMLASYAQAPNISFDYGVMEAGTNNIVLPGDFRWNDLGGYTAFRDVVPKDADGNVVLSGQLLAEKAKDLTVYSGSKKKVVVVSDVSSIVVIDMDDVLYICDAANTEKTKELLEILNAKGYGSLE